MQGQQENFLRGGKKIAEGRKEDVKIFWDHNQWGNKVKRNGVISHPDDKSHQKNYNFLCTLAQAALEPHGTIGAPPPGSHSFIWRNRVLKMFAQQLFTKWWTSPHPCLRTSLADALFVPINDSPVSNEPVNLKNVPNRQGKAAFLMYRMSYTIWFASFIVQHLKAFTNKIVR